MICPIYIRYRDHDETQAMPIAVRDGAELYWSKTGAGPPLILGAGLNGSGTWWDSNRPTLAERANSMELIE